MLNELSYPYNILALIVLKKKTTLRMARENQLSDRFHLQLRVEENSWGTSRMMKQ